MDETSTIAVTPLLALGDADAAVADGFCAVPGPRRRRPARARERASEG